MMAKSKYDRWDTSSPLNHEARAAIYEIVEQSPGAYLSEICASVDVTLSTTRYHLNVLEDEGKVTRTTIRGKRRYYRGHDNDVQLIAALDDEGTKSVLYALARLGKASGMQLAEELERDSSTVSHHLSRLEKTGLIEREREGRTIVNRIVPNIPGEMATTVETPG